MKSDIKIHYINRSQGKNPVSIFLVAKRPFYQNLTAIFYLKSFN